MKDTKGNLVLGRTRWRRFAAVAVPATMLAVGLFAGVANGAVPIMLNVSGQQFKVSADRLDGTGFAQYPAVVVKPDGTRIPVAASAIDDVTLTKLCQSVKLQGLPISLVIRANDGATAKNLLIGLDHLQGDATFKNIDIGKDASKLSKGGSDNKGSLGEFGQEADEIHIVGVKQSAYSVHAGTFTLNGLDMRVSLSGEECFASFATP